MESKRLYVCTDGFDIVSVKYFTNYEAAREILNARENTDGTWEWRLATESDLTIKQ